MTHNEEPNAPGVSNTDLTAAPQRYEWTELGRPSTAVVEGVADATGRSPADVAPPDSHVDPDTLDALLTSVGDEDVSVSFTHDAAEVTINSDGTLVVWPDEAELGREVAAPRSDAELNDRLRHVLDAAFESGVNVLGGWAIRNGPGLPDWDVHVTETAKLHDESTPAVRGGDVGTE